MVQKIQFKFKLVIYNVKPVKIGIPIIVIPVEGLTE